MTKVAIIIPYFQREAGVLRRALDSIFAQDVGPEIRVDILIADDASPAPPEPETAGVVREGFSVRIIKRPNGGPAAARNTALDAAGDAGAIAFLDSDDVWAPHHLRRGLSALAQGAQFYFADNRYDETATWFSGIQGISAIIDEAERGQDGLLRMPREQAMEHFLRHCLSHTSTVICDARTIADLRFDEGQAIAGEDYLFWLASVDRSQTIAFDSTPGGARGRGVDLYRRSLDWDHPEAVRRLYYALLAHKAVKARFCRTPEQHKNGQDQIARLRRSIAYLMARNALRHPEESAWVGLRLLSNDPGSCILLPWNMALTLLQKARGRLDFWAG